MEVGAVQQRIEVSGSGNAALALGQVGGDVRIGHVGNVQVVAETQFFDLDVDQLRSESWLEPRAAQQLVGLLDEHRVLILAGSLGDKGECARDLAYLLGRRLCGNGGARPAVRERWRGQEPQRLESALRGDGPTILLLTEISKSQVAGYGLDKLASLLRDRNGYAIITTECSRAQWDIEAGSQQALLWQELSWQVYYGHAELSGYLQRLLIGSDLPVPEGLLPDGPEGVLLIEGLSLAVAAEKLKSPMRAVQFVDALLKGYTVPSLESIRSKLAELAGDAAAIHQWYEQFEPRDQLLAVGLVLLDGLPDDLLFAGLELLVESTWRGTDPLLAQFDYHDLSRFAAYFKETQVDGGFVRIESGSRDNRRNILEAAWRNQRRRLLATLPALTEMIRVSASKPPPSAAGGQKSEPPAQQVPRDSVSVGRSAARALGRTTGGSVQLHQVLVESLSLIGLLSIEVVEPYLLDLAADPSENVQHLVAAALAAWRAESKDRRLFELLRRWWSEACDVGDSGSRIARAERLGSDPWAAVRAAVALAIGYAAQYDGVDDLAVPLHDLLAQLMIDPHPRVRGVVESFTLSRVVAWHFLQLEPLLRTRALAVTDYIAAVARGAAAACEMRPETCLPILDSWRARARAERPGAGGGATTREILLATVALTWGYIHCDEEQPRLSAAVVTSKLRSLVTEESHPFVRHHAFFAIEIQTQRNYALAAQLLQALLARVSLADRPAMIELAVRTYLYQRHQFESGDRRIEVGGRSYAVWTESARPLTGLEASLYSWILDDSRPVAQQLAVDIFTALSDTDLDREERRLRLSATSYSAASPAATAVIPGHPVAAGVAPAQTRRLGPLGHLAVLLAAPRKPLLRPLLKPLLAEVVFEWRRRPARAGTPKTPPRVAQDIVGDERIAALLARWGEVRNAATNAIAAYLRRALSIYRWRWGLVLAAALLLLGTWDLGREGWKAWSRHRASAARPAQVQPVDERPPGPR